MLGAANTAPDGVDNPIPRPVPAPRAPKPGKRPLKPWERVARTTGHQQEADVIVEWPVVGAQDNAKE